MLWSDILKYTYCGRCYTTAAKNLLPFGFCKPCWVDKGKPVKMKVIELNEEYKSEGKPADEQGY
jgi:hypothetical protein